MRSRRTVQKDGPNKGRLFYSCPKGMNESCKFFQWEMKTFKIITRHQEERILIHPEEGDTVEVRIHKESLGQLPALRGNAEFAEGKVCTAFTQCLVYKLLPVLCYKFVF